MNITIKTCRIWLPFLTSKFGVKEGTGFTTARDDAFKLVSFCNSLVSLDADSLSSSSQSWNGGRSLSFLFNLSKGLRSTGLSSLEILFEVEIVDGGSSNNERLVKLRIAIDNAYLNCPL